MPKYGVHTIVIDEACSRLDQSGGNAQTKAREIQENARLAKLGAIGPDLFFWAPDWTANRAIKKIIDAWSGLRVAHAALNAPINVLESIVEGGPGGGTVEIINTTIDSIRDAFSGLFTSALAALFGEAIAVEDWQEDPPALADEIQSIFQGFCHTDPATWTWFDRLHYKSTGTFAKSLVNLANTPGQRAFAYGYLSHVATDVAGHPYVNQVTGTVYRFNVQRHSTVENFIDTWAYNKYRQRNINKNLRRDLGLTATLDGEIVDLLKKGFETAYPNVSNNPSASDIEKTYNLFYEVLKLLDEKGLEKPESPVDEILDILQDILDDFDPPPSPPGDLGTGSLDLSRLFDWFADTLQWIGDTVLNLIDLIGAAVTALLSAPILAIAYGIKMLAYTLMRHARTMLAYAGIVTPETDEVGHTNPVALSLLQPAFCSVMPYKFPLKKLPVNNLACPVADVEQPPTVAGFAPANSFPDYYIDQLPFDEGRLEAYAKADDRAKRQACWADGGFGSAVQFSEWMIRNSNETSKEKLVYADWNLDADRGYGFLGK